MGQLPIVNGKLLPINAIKTLLDDAKPDNSENEGIAGKLVKLSVDIANRTEKTNLGDIPTAIAALKSMLATYDGLLREESERLTMMHSDGIIGHAQSVIDNAQSKPSIETIEAMRDNGQIDDVTYQIMMLEHHNIEIEFE